MEQALAQRHAGGLGLGADVAHAEAHDQGHHRERRLDRLPVGRETPEQAREQDHVRHSIEHGVHERAGATGLAPVTRHRPVEHVARPGEDQDRSRCEPPTGHDQHARDDVEREREQGQLPRPDPGP